MVSPPTTCSSLQRIRVPRTTLQVSFVIFILKKKQKQFSVYLRVVYVGFLRDLKEHLRRLQQQSDTRRRAAVMEMMRQRAAEVASNDG